MNKEQLVLAGLVHDLNNVLQTLGQASDLLSTDPAWADLAETIAAGVDRGRLIVASLSEAPAEARLRDIAARAAGGNTIAVANHIPDTLTLTCKPASLVRVLQNLIANSARAGATQVTLDAVRERHTIRIDVSDNGPGIPTAILPSLFRPGVSTTSSTGLGLHIVQSIIEDHRGTVTAANRKDGGASFTLCIPA